MPTSQDSSGHLASHDACSNAPPQPLWRLCLAQPLLQNCKHTKLAAQPANSTLLDSLQF